MRLVEILSCRIIIKEIKKLRERLFNNPELRARQIYEFAIAQPIEVKEYLQGYLNDCPLTKKVEKYVTADDYD